MNERKLTEVQIQLVMPEFVRLQQLEQEVRDVMDRRNRMLCLIEPGIAEKDSGITFDPSTMSFKYPSPDIAGDGVAASAAVNNRENGNGE